jgi:hypothetical protein
MNIQCNRALSRALLCSFGRTASQRSAIEGTLGEMNDYETIGTSTATTNPSASMSSVISK